jgi:histidinol-phosphate phosphatase family protein
VAVRRALFVDKDGTLIEDLPYNVDPRRITLTPGIITLLRAAAAAGFRLIVVSNQPGVALGRFPASALAAVAARLDELLARAGLVLDGCYFCPHRPAPPGTASHARCACRKPLPGLILQAARAHRIALGASWMIGDILDDVEAGRRAGCRTILLDRGHETEWRRGPLRVPDLIVRRPEEAVPALLARAPARGARAMPP